MRVKRVTADDLEETYCCMNEIPSNVAWAEYLPESREWFKSNLGKTVEGYHLLDNDRVVGHIYYARSENALIPYEVESNVACIYCTEVLRDYTHKGYGRMMFEHVKADLKERGFKGIVVSATDFDEWMHYELFLKQGFRVVKEHPPYKAMYFPLTQKSINLKVIDLKYTPARDKVEVTLFRFFFCPVGAHMYYLIKRVAGSFGDKVEIVEIEATPETVREYGTADPLINGKIKLYGPASEQDVREKIQEEIAHLHSHF